MRSVVGSAALIGFCAAFIVSPADAADYYLKCSITRNYDQSSGLTLPASGTDVYGVTAKTDGTSAYTIPLACDTGTTRSMVTEGKLSFGCRETVQGIVFDRTAIIDRVSGDYQSAFIPRGRSNEGLVHYGSCQKAEPQF